MRFRRGAASARSRFARQGCEAGHAHLATDAQCGSPRGDRRERGALCGKRPRGIDLRRRDQRA